MRTRAAIGSAASIGAMVVVLVAAGCGGSRENSDDIIATFDGGVITGSEVLDFLQSRDRPRLRGDDAVSEAEGMEQLIRRLATIEILASEVDEAEIEDPPTSMYLDARARHLVRHYMEVVGKVSYQVTDEEARARYEELKDTRFTYPERVKVQYVFLRSDHHTDEEAGDLLREMRAGLRAGRPFEELVAEHSESGTKTRAGIFGPVFRGKMDADFEDQIYARAGDREPFVARTATGHFLVRILSYDPRRPIPFEEAKPGLVSMLLNERTERDREALLGGLRERHRVVFEPEYATLEPDAVVLQISDRSMTREELESFLDADARPSASSDTFGPQDRTRRIDRLIDANLLYLDAVDRGLDVDPVFEAGWRATRLRQRAGLARQRRFDVWSSALTEEETMAGYEANPTRYVTPGSYGISYVFVPFRSDREPFERQRVAEELADLLRGGKGDDEVERRCLAAGAEYVELGVISGSDALWLGPEPHRTLMTMDSGEVSQPIQVSGGMLVLEVGEISPRRQLEPSDGFEAIRRRHADLRRGEFMSELEDRVLVERSFRLLSTDVFETGTLEGSETGG